MDSCADPLGWSIALPWAPERLARVTRPACRATCSADAIPADSSDLPPATRWCSGKGATEGGGLCRTGGGDAHAAAIVHAYALIEAAQGEDLGGELDVAGAEAEAYGWDDVLALIHYARMRHA